MKNTSYIIGTAIICTSMASCSKIIKIHSEEDYVSQEIGITESFHTIKTLATADIEYTSGPTRITLKIPEGEKDIIRVYVKDSVLVVTRIDEDRTENKTVCGYDHLKLIVSSPNVRNFETYGTGDIKITSLNAGNVTFTTYGTGDITCGPLKCVRIDAISTGTGDIEIERADCENAYLETDGTGDIEIRDIKAGLVRASTNGTGDISLGGECSIAQLEENSIGDINAKKLKINNKK